MLEAPDDAAFLQSLRHSCARVSGVYPPLALVEAYITEEDSVPRVRRLHLITVDLHRRRRMAHRVLKLLTDLQIDRCAGECLNTLSIPWKPNQGAYQLRYVFGYVMTGSSWSSCPQKLGIDHLVAVMKDRKITFVGHHELVSDPVLYFPNVCAGIDVAQWRVPENG